tara:strand:- start:948 stop:1280 length:333 start_codon:yes stop_codon:yes gene_type:complete
MIGVFCFNTIYYTKKEYIMGKKRRAMFNPKFKNSHPELWKLGRRLLGIPTEEELEEKRLEEARLKAEEEAKLKAEQEAKLKEEKETKKKTATKKTTKKRRTTTKKTKKED